MPGGRPRAFDADEVLDAAIEVFWRYGYQGASLQELTAAMGINKASLYAAFDRNRICFIGRWPAMPRPIWPTRCARSTNRQLGTSSEPCFATTFEALHSTRSAAGMPLHSGRRVLRPSNAAVTRFLATSRLAGEQALADRLARAVRDGDISSAADPAASLDS